MTILSLLKPKTKKLEINVGNDYPISFALAVPWKDFRFDPNGYYKILGLRANRAWLMGEIRSAYQAALRKYHPDTADGDTDTTYQFELTRIAGEVLLDPITRRSYDELAADDKWMDKFVKETKRRDIRRDFQKTEPTEDELWDMMRRYDAMVRREEYIEKTKREKTAREAEGYVYTQDDASKLDEVDLLGGETVKKKGFTYYYEDGISIPTDLQIETWLHCVAYAHWILKIPGPVRVGFTEKEFRVERRKWGSVLMVNNKVEANQSVALWLVKEGTK